LVSKKLGFSVAAADGEGEEAQAAVAQFRHDVLERAYFYNGKLPAMPEDALEAFKKKVTDHKKQWGARQYALPMQDRISLRLMNARDAQVITRALDDTRTNFEMILERRSVNSAHVWHTYGLGF
jgi:hypothetical protein